MVEVVEVYTDVMLREVADLATTPPTSFDFTLPAAPLEGDVLVLIKGGLGDHGPGWDVDSRQRYADAGTLVGCGLDGLWQRLYWYDAGAPSVTANVQGTAVGVSSVGGGMAAYAVRVPAGATAGTITANFYWDPILYPGGPDPLMTSMSVMILVLRGLPDLGEDLSHTLVPYIDRDDAHGVYGAAFDAGYVSADGTDFPIPASQVWTLTNNPGPGYSSSSGLRGYEVLPGQVVITAAIANRGDGLDFYDDHPATGPAAQVSTAEIILGDVDDNALGTRTNAVMRAQYATPATRTYYTSGFTVDSHDWTFSQHLMLVIGPGTPAREGLPLMTGVAEMTGSLAGYAGAGGSTKEARYPGVSAEGDLVVAILVDRYTPSFPGGWTLVRSASSATMNAKVGWRVLSAADVTSGGFSYSVSGSGFGSGEWITVVYKAGTFVPGAPFGDFVDSVAVDGNEVMPYVIVNTGQTIYHYNSVRVPSSPGQTIVLAPVYGSEVVRRCRDADMATALYLQNTHADTTLNADWHYGMTGSVPPATTGSYKISWTMAIPAMATVWPAMDAEAFIMVAVFDFVPDGPDPDEFLLNTAPTLSGYADGTPSPFQIQWQVAPTSSFGSTLWSATTTGHTPGPASVTVGTALPNNSSSYWRARAGDGSSWGAWSAPSRLRIYVNRSNAQEYQHENVGAELVLRSEALEYQHNNVGLPLSPTAEGHEYLHENVGFQVVLKRDAGDYLHENVFVGTPVPHLWFAWLEYGFPLDHIFIYGQGLGTLMSEYHASVRIFDVNTNTDQALTVFDWSVNPAGTHAYDSLRKIYRGAGAAAPPIVTQEADIVEVVIPTGVASPTTVIDFFFVRTDGGTSNRIPWTLYPQIPFPMASAPMSSRTANVMRLTPFKTADNPIPGILAAFAPQPYTVSAGMLEELPEHLVSSRSTFTFASAAGTANLEDPLGTPVPLGARWRPLGASIVARPDIGTGVSLWEPVSGSDNAWRIDNGTDPYIDPLYEVPSRNGMIARPAMIFPGDAWMDSLDTMHAGDPTFSLVLVATVKTNPTTSSPNSGGVLLSGHVPGGQPGGTYPFDLALYGETLYLRVGVVTNRNLRVWIPPDYLGVRPVILAVTIDLDATNTPVATLTLLSNAMQRVTGTIEPIAGGSHLYLGRAAEPGQEARMDVLEVSLGAALTQKQESELLAALDGAYGVSGA